MAKGGGKLYRFLKINEEKISRVGAITLKCFAILWFLLIWRLGAGLLGYLFYNLAMTSHIVGKSFFTISRLNSNFLGFTLGVVSDFVVIYVFGISIINALGALKEQISSYTSLAKFIKKAALSITIVLFYHVLFILLTKSFYSEYGAYYFISFFFGCHCTLVLIINHINIFSRYRKIFYKIILFYPITDFVVLIFYFLTK